MLSRYSLAAKLSFLVFPFILALLLLASMLSYERWQTRQAMQHSEALIEMATAASQLIHDLQTERGLSNGFLAGNAATLPQGLRAARLAADHSLQAFLAAGPLGADKERLGELASLRVRVEGRQLSSREAFDAYSARIEGLTSLIAQLTSSNRDGDILRSTASLLDLQCVKEFAGRERGYVNGVLSAGGFNQESLMQSSALAAHQQACAQQFDLISNAALRLQMETLAGGEASKAMQELRQQLPRQENGVGSLTPDAWFKASSRRILELKGLQDQVLRDLGKLARDKVEAAQRELMLTLAGASLAIVLLSLLGVAIYRGVHHPVRRLEGLMTQMSKNLDLGPRANVHGRDEVARMSRAFNALVDAFADTLRLAKTNAHDVVDSVRELQRIANQAAAASDTQSQSASQIAAAIEEMSTGIEAVTQNTQDSMGAARQMQQRIQEGRERMQETAGIMSKTSMVLTDAGGRIESLQQRSEAIRSIITAIREIADQTNLLALNAAIEAARAGEMGRGFAVVADEVRKLAERTGKETLGITELIEAIGQETQSATLHMQEANRSMDSGLEWVGQTTQDLSRMHEEASDTVQKSQDTAAAMAQQASASSEVAGNVSVIAGLAEDSADLVQRVAALSQRLHDSTVGLMTMVDRFQRA